MLPNPLAHLPMLRMAPVPPRFQKVGIAAGSAYVFRRAGPLPIETPGVRQFLLRGGFDTLNGDLMPPGVAEIVLVDKGGALFRRDIGQADSPVILVEIVVLWTRLALVDAFLCARYNKLMEMGVRPAHRDLQHLVQLMQGEIRRHDNAPPDRRLDLGQADRQRVLEVSASRWHSLLLS